MQRHLVRGLHRACRVSYVTIAALGSTKFSSKRQSEAKRGKTRQNECRLVYTWVNVYFGFKLHLLVSDKGELINVTVTTGNTEDRKPVPDLLRSLFGKVFGDKGYISQRLQEALLERNIDLITKPRKNMKTENIRPLSATDQWLLRKRDYDHHRDSN